MRPVAKCCTCVGDIGPHARTCPVSLASVAPPSALDDTPEPEAAALPAWAMERARVGALAYLGDEDPPEVDLLAGKFAPLVAAAHREGWEACREVSAQAAQSRAHETINHGAYSDAGDADAAEARSFAAGCVRRVESSIFAIPYQEPTK